MNTEVSELQKAKTALPMTLEEMVISCNEVQKLKACPLISVRLSGMETETNELQSLKAPPQIVFTQVE